MIRNCDKCHSLWMRIILPDARRLPDCGDVVQADGIVLETQ